MLLLWHFQILILREMDGLTFYVEGSKDLACKYLNLHCIGSSTYQHRKDSGFIYYISLNLILTVPHILQGLAGKAESMWSITFGKFT